MQGDDLKIKIRNIEDKSYVNTIDSAYNMARPIFTDKYMAISDTSYMYLINTDDYGISAKVPGGGAFFGSDKSFILTSGSRLYSTYYKDYKTLIEEAKRQFPNAELTDEKKVKYNVN